MARRGRAGAERGKESWTLASVMTRGSPEDRTGINDRPTLSGRFPRPWLFPLLVFGATWGLIVAAWHVSNAVYRLSWPWERYFVYADGQFYTGIAMHFYAQRPGHPPPFGLPPTQAAFFPVFPLLIRAASYLTFHDFTVASLVAAVTAGAASAIAVWALAARIGGRPLADRAVVLYCAFPGAMALGLPYSEPLGIALAAASLLAALNHKWLLAGSFALFATAEHPTLLVLAPALGVAALEAIRARREWRALIAPLLAPLGFLGYTAWMGGTYHDYFFLGHLEGRYWRHHTDWGAYEFHVLTGIATALERTDSSWLFLTDSDGQFRAAQVPWFLAEAAAERADAVIGFRQRRADPAIRKVNAWLWTRATRLLLGVSVRDVDCAYKLIHRRLLDGVELRGEAALISPELL